MSNKLSYVVDEKGHKTGVIVPVENFEALLGRQEDSLNDEDRESSDNRWAQASLDKRLAAMQAAATDPLFLSDLDEIAEDFKYIDAESASE